MIEKEKVIVFDIDGTICHDKQKDQSYEHLEINTDMIALLKEYKSKGFYIILDTSRNMNSHEGNIGKINATTLKTILAWLDKNNIPYDEIHVGKPWCGRAGFCVDDKTIRPSEMLSMNYTEIMALLEKEKQAMQKLLKK